MRILIQRVTRASVTVEGKLEGTIGRGLLLLVGVAGTDSRANVDYLADKVVNLRIFSDHQGRMNLSVKDTGGDLLVVSQFTLYADTSRGRRPGFEAAAPPALARELYEYAVSALRARGMVVRTGVFQADMKVELVNDGPVTIMLESAG